MSDLHPQSHHDPNGYLRSIGASIAAVLGSPGGRQAPGPDSDRWTAPLVRWDPDSLQGRNTVRVDPSSSSTNVDIGQIVMDHDAARRLGGRMLLTPAEVLDGVTRGFVEALNRHVPEAPFREIVAQVAEALRAIPRTTPGQNNVLRGLANELSAALRPRAPGVSPRPSGGSPEPATPSTPEPVVGGTRPDRGRNPDIEREERPPVPLSWSQMRDGAQGECERLRDSLNRLASRLGGRSIRGSSQHANVALEVARILKTYVTGLDEVTSVDQFLSSEKGQAAAREAVIKIKDATASAGDPAEAGTWTGHPEAEFARVMAVSGSPATVRSPAFAAAATLGFLNAMDRALPSREARGWTD